MAEIKPSKKVGVSQAYEYTTEVNPNAKMFCARTGVSKCWKDLTDEDIKAMIAKGNKNFKPVSAEVKVK